MTLKLIEESLEKWSNHKAVIDAKNLVERLRAIRYVSSGRPSVTAAALVYLTDPYASQREVAEFYNCLEVTLRSRMKAIQERLNLPKLSYKSGFRSNHYYVVNDKISIPQDIWGELRLSFGDSVQWEIMDLEKRTVKLTFSS